MTVSTEQVGDVLGRVSNMARRTEVSPDPVEAQQLLEAVEEAGQELRTLATRLRIVLRGGEPCNTPPDLTGQCMRCGLRSAPPVANQAPSLDHQPGCNPLKLALRVVRVVRWTRLTYRTLTSPAASPRGGDSRGHSVSSPAASSAPGKSDQGGE